VADPAQKVLYKHRRHIKEYAAPLNADLQSFITAQVRQDYAVDRRSSHDVVSEEPRSVRLSIDSRETSKRSKQTVPNGAKKIWEESVVSPAARATSSLG
jgi:hypothetical protein